MATNIELYDAMFSNVDIEKRVVVACLKIADQIIHEDPATENHELRMSFARAVLNNPTGAARKVMPTLIVSPDIGWDATDAEIQAVIASNVDAYAPVI